MDDALRVGVVGAGAWGTALAKLLTERGHEVALWAYEAEVVDEIRRSGVNPYLADVRLPDALTVTTDLAGVVTAKDLVVSVSPSQFVREIMVRAAPHVGEGTVVVSASKGIELPSLKRMDEVLDEVLPPTVMELFCVLSGPSFAREVARGEPTAVVVAGRDEDAALRVQRAFQTPSFRVYTNRDVVGVELGGALKNVMALAAGIAVGLGYGHNTMAALITRGLAEMTRLGVAMGAEASTFSGLAGMGDLVLTCTGGLSRNRTVGVRLGRGERLDEILRDMQAVAEGVKTAEAVPELARRVGVEMPIAEQVYLIVHEGKSAADALRDLMLREPKPEEWS